MVRFSYIVLFHNNSDTCRVIESILAQKEKDEDIVLVDDHSTVESLETLAPVAPFIKLVHTDRAGNRGYNRNFGVQFADNDNILFVDGDIILLPETINAMRICMQRGYVGAVGNVILSNNTPEQANLLCGKDYLNLLRKNLSIENLIDLDFWEDRRGKYLFDKIATSSLWEYFFTAYCAVKREAFEAIGGFDTRFVGWGVEDDELGYRLSQVGELSYCSSAYGVHIPHARNRYQCMYSNRINLYRFLAKFPSVEVELHMIFGHSLKNSHVIKYIQKRLLESGTVVHEVALPPNTIFVNEITAQYPSGLIRFTGADVYKEEKLELLGLALPFKNQNFVTGICAEDIFAYPQAIVAAILAELLRVSQEVHIIKTNHCLRIKWNAEQITAIDNISTSNRIIYTPSGICDFDIEDRGEYYCVYSGMPNKLNDHFWVNENFYKPELFYTPRKRYLVLNLTDTKLSANEILQLKADHEIDIIACYDVSISMKQTPVILSEELFCDFYRLHTPILYVLPPKANIDKTDYKWWGSHFREQDIIVQKT